MEPFVQDREPNIVASGLSRTVTIDEVTVEVQIYRLEHDSQWTLEVVNGEGTSTVWDARARGRMRRMSIFCGANSRLVRRCCGHCWKRWTKHNCIPRVGRSGGGKKALGRCPNPAGALPLDPAKAGPWMPFIGGR